MGWCAGELVGPLKRGHGLAPAQRKEPSAKSKEQRAKSKEQRAKSMAHRV